MRLYVDTQGSIQGKILFLEVDPRFIGSSCLFILEKKKLYICSVDKAYFVGTQNIMLDLFFLSVLSFLCDSHSL